MFAFLAGVRNYSAVVPIADARGLPEDFERVDDYEPDVGDHSFSWLSVNELLAFDYDAAMEDRRVTVQTGPNSFNGAATCEPGQGQEMTWRTFLGEKFFENLDALKALGADRIVFGFDS